VSLIPVAELLLIVFSPPETTKLILQTLLTISCQPEGALELLNIEDYSPLTEIAAQNPLVLDILKFSWTNAIRIDGQVDTVRKKMDMTMPLLLNVFRGTDAVTLIRFAGSLLSNIIPEVS